jgi:hypothetical protein
MPTVNAPERSGIQWLVMQVEKIIADIEALEQLYTLPDKRPLTTSDREAANQRHDATYANNPWFRLWQHFGC